MKDDVYSVLARGEEVALLVGDLVMVRLDPFGAGLLQITAHEDTDTGHASLCVFLNWKGRVIARPFQEMPPLVESCTIGRSGLRRFYSKTLSCYPVIQNCSVHDGAAKLRPEPALGDFFPKSLVHYIYEMRPGERLPYHCQSPTIPQASDLDMFWRWASGLVVPMTSVALREAVSCLEDSELASVYGVACMLLHLADVREIAILAGTMDENGNGSGDLFLTDRCALVFSGQSGFERVVLDRRPPLTDLQAFGFGEEVFYALEDRIEKVLGDAYFYRAYEYETGSNFDGWRR